jgi:hypothetical protein
MAAILPPFTNAKILMADLPKACDKGAKKDSKGNIMYSRVFYIKLQS